MADEIERLVVSLEARVNQFEKAMNRAERKTDQTTKQIEGRFSKMGSALATQFGALAGRLVAPLAGGAALVAFRDIARSIANVGDQAQIAGISVERFSELRFVAEQNRIGIDALTDGLKELQLRADEFVVTGSGGAAEAFQRLGYDAETLSQKLRDPVDLFYEIIGQLEDLDAAAQIRIADEIFGGQGGERFVQLIEQGEQGLRDTAQAARDAGVVINDELVAKANELDRAFSNAAMTVGSTLQQAIVNAGWALYDFMQQFQSVENRTTVSLQNSLRELGARRVDLERMIAEQESLARTAPESIPGVMGNANAAVADRVQSLRDEMAGLVDEERAILDVLNSRTLVEPPQMRITVPGSGSGGDNDSGGGGPSAITAQRDAVAELIAQLEHERALLGMSNVEREIANALRKAGAAATAQEQQQIIGLVTAISAETAAIEKTQEAMENLRDIGSSVLKGFAQDLRSGKSATEALNNAFGRLADRLLDMALDTAIQGLFSSLAGSFFGGSAKVGGGLFGSGGFPGFASGTANTGGLRGQVRGVVHGQEAVIPLPNGGRVPVEMRMPMLPQIGKAANDNDVSVVRVELGEGLEGRILQRAGRQSVQIVSAAAPGIIEGSKSAAGSALRGGDFDGAMGRFGIQPQPKRR